MRTRFFPVMVVLFVLAAASPLSSQYTPAQISEVDHARHSLAVYLLRAINTAEATHKMRYGSYLTWDLLLASEEFSAGRLMMRLVKYDPQLADAHFSNGADILPGWSLRLNLIGNGEGYDVMLQDSTDKPCGYAAVTDERGVIWQSKTIDCEI